MEDCRNPELRVIKAPNKDARQHAIQHTASRESFQQNLKERVDL